jgi:DNA polymerase
MIDRVIRMFTEPVFVGDVEKLRGAVATEKQRKIDLLRGLNLICPKCGGSGVSPQLALVDPFPQPCKYCKGLGVDIKVIGSNDKIAALFRQCGIEPETKTSPTTGEQIYAFAKTDPAMQDLLEDEYEDVRALAEARIAVKSNIVETRAQRFQHEAERGVMPVYISPFAAHTFRCGGGDSMNWLNISSKHNANRPELSVIAASIQAPPGHKIITADSGQGEARITAWLAGQHDLVAAFAQGRDVYSEHASTIYGRPVDRKHVKADHIPGQLGKVSILGMGFGMGWYKAAMELLKGMLGNPPLQFVMADMEMLQVDPSRFLNNPKKIAMVNEMPSRLELNDRLIHCIVAEALVQRYRARYPQISGSGLPKGSGYWNLMEDVINAMIRGEEMVFGAHGVMRTCKDGIWMPNGLKLRYDGIERDQKTGDATYWNGRKRTKIHGPLLTENTVQSLHYIIVSRQLLEIAEVLKVALTTYDDVVCVVPEDSAEMALQFMVQTMSKTPAWATGLPLIGEGKIGDTLKEAS